MRTLSQKAVRVLRKMSVILSTKISTPALHVVRRNRDELRPGLAYRRTRVVGKADPSASCSAARLKNQETKLASALWSTPVPELSQRTELSPSRNKITSQEDGVVRFPRQFDQRKKCWQQAASLVASCVLHLMVLLDKMKHEQ